MSRRANPESPRCSYCDARCGNSSYLHAHKQDCEHNPVNARERAAVQRRLDDEGDAR